MAGIFLERMDSAPLQNDDFSAEMDSWLSNMIDSYNEAIRIIQDALNQNFGPQPYTTAEIIDMAATARDGAEWYCTDSVPPTPVMKVNGALVKFTTTPFP